MNVCRLLILSSSLLLPFELLAGPPTGATEVWLGPQSPKRAVDFLDMFTPDAPWKQAAAHVNVFKLYEGYLIDAPQDHVDKIVADLNRRHISIALEGGLMNVGEGSANPPPPCGGWGRVEGYSVPKAAMLVANKVKKAGGYIKYFAMDEPVWYGHYYQGQPGHLGCHSSVDEIVKVMESNLRVYTDAFPGIVVGDIEPTNLAEQQNWQAEFSAFSNRFREATGTPLAFLHLDVLWETPNKERSVAALFRYAETLKRQGYLGKIGIIYNGSGNTGELWIQSAHDKILSIEVKDALRPDQAIIQSWSPYPTHTMPDSSPNSLTSLVNFYVGIKRR